MSLGAKCPQISGLTWVKGGPMPCPPPGVCVIEFWATWCPPCRQTVPHLTALQRRYKGRAVVIGISMDDDFERLKCFVEGQGDAMDYAVAADLSGSAQQGLYLQSQATGVPHAFVLDADHRVVYSGHPMDPQMVQKLDAALAAAGSAAGAGTGAPAGAGATEKRAVPPVTESYDELMAGRSVKELKELLKERGVPFADCLEKGDLARRVVERCSRVTHYV